MWNVFIQAPQINSAASSSCPMQATTNTQRQTTTTTSYKREDLYSVLVLYVDRYKAEWISPEEVWYGVRWWLHFWNSKRRRAGEADKRHLVHSVATVALVHKQNYTSWSMRLRHVSINFSNLYTRRCSLIWFPLRPPTVHLFVRHHIAPNNNNDGASAANCNRQLTKPASQPS